MCCLLALRCCRSRCCSESNAAAGDYHPGNFLLSDQGLLAIDLEFTHVGCAVNDLAYVLHWLPHATRSTSCRDKRRVLSAYIEAITNQQLEAEDVDLLLFDAESARIRVSPII